MNATEGVYMEEGTDSDVTPLPTANEYHATSLEEQLPLGQPSPDHHENIDAVVHTLPAEGAVQPIWDFLVPITSAHPWHALREEFFGGNSDSFDDIFGD
ncbi:hypothetical protein NLJ89_g10915 [Agrocybe chaxingu]|uniref:Uncharacterized protein n=1 Tax=Agrocybe chaxingu TaxID=84603 RepID=A0A9W8MS53_9AGAR|nr:hypothetical protein NLJ89_g10915 [Agrocybe chaxingu]